MGTIVRDALEWQQLLATTPGLQVVNVPNPKKDTDGRVPSHFAVLTRSKDHDPDNRRERLLAVVAAARCLGQAWPCPRGTHRTPRVIPEKQAQCAN
jgi:hypothetical protein